MVEAKRHPADFALWKLTAPGVAAPAGVGLAVGPGVPRLAHRVLGHGHQVPRRPLRHPHRRHRPRPRAPHQRGGPERVRPRRAPLGRVVGPHRVPRPRRREDLQVQGRPAARRLARRPRHRPARLPLLHVPDPLPPAAGVHLRRRGGRRHGVCAGCMATRSRRATPAARWSTRPWWRSCARGSGPRSPTTSTPRRRSPSCPRSPRTRGWPRRTSGPCWPTPTAPSASAWPTCESDAGESDPRIDGLVAEREAPGPPRTSPPPTACATSWPPRASRSSTPPSGPTWRRGTPFWRWFSTPGVTPQRQNVLGQPARRARRRS